MNSITVTVNPDEWLADDSFGPGSRLRWEWSDDGVTFNSLTTQALVSGQTEYTVHHKDGVATTQYRYRFSTPTPVAPSDYSGYVGPFLPITTVVPVADVRAMVKTPLSDRDLLTVINREEGMLAAEVGALSGERVETFTITDQTYAIPVRLRRPTAAVVVTEDNVTTSDVRLGPDGRTVQRLTATGWSAGAWTGAVEATYTPNDLARVTTWVIELVRARLTETGYDSESDGTYTYSRGARSHDQVMAAAIADILGRKQGGPRAIHSIRVSTSATRAAWIGTTRP